MPVVNINNAEHYRWGGKCDAWHLLQTRRLSVIQERVPPGGAERPHYHSHSTQVFYVLEGQVRFTNATEVLEIGPGDSITVLPGVVHYLENPGGGDAVLLVVSAPESHSDRFEVDVKDTDTGN